MATINQEKVLFLEDKARKIRVDIIKMVYQAQAGHPGGSLSAADIVTALYFDILNIDPTNPNWEERDRFILSKGHACPVWYACLAERGYFAMENLSRLRQINSILQGHPDMNKTTGIDMTTGSLGQGLSAGVGMALGGKVQNLNYKVYVMLGDGELDEGQVWEAAMAANKFKLNNLIAILDNNGLQLDGKTEDIMPLEPLVAKWDSFGWSVREINGHNMEEILTTFYDLKEYQNKPTIIIAHTVKGKGVSFMEDKLDWHGKAPNDEQYKLAMAELEGSFDDK
ncbi:MAG: transketolase [Actinobacteria bacterium]|nr:transketolase [Actinomycetota bacterium]